MDKRSWPWKKKSSERSSALNDFSELSPVHSSRHTDDQIVSSILMDQSRMSDEGMAQSAQSQHVEEKVKQLNEKLSVALLNVSAKDELAKQHAKVAEEAVSGWEKAEAEAVALKQQLDSLTQQKLATEDRVSHLEGALKECMWQLRHVREEQEEKIHDAIAKKTRDWDRVRSELEEKLAVAEQKYLERDAESTAMSKLLQERARSISEVGEAHSQAEAELNMLQIRLESVEKENASLKYELTVLNKELQIRNEERVISKKAADAASKQHVEDVKKIAKLEGECQRLRGLVRQKLPGPAALAQMKLEIEGPGKEKVDLNRRRGAKGAGSPRAAAVKSGDDMAQEDASNAGKDVDALSERLNAMEDETKMLKEVLAKRNNELQSSRLMCARTASKLSSVEQQLNALTHAHGIPKAVGMSGLAVHVESTISLSNSFEPSLTSLSEDGNDGEVTCAESWASALIAELDQFKRGKPIHNLENTLNSSQREQLMDDFIEMEQLASLSASKFCKSTPTRAGSNNSGSNIVENITGFEQSLAKKDAELHEAHQLCEEMGSKLASAEEQLAALQSKSASDESSLLILREKLDMIFEAQEDGANLGKVLDDVRAAMGVPRHSMARLRAHIRRLSKGCNPSDASSTISRESSELIGLQGVSAAVESSSEEEASFCTSDADCKLHAIGPELTSAICKVVRLVEDLAVASTSHQLSDFSRREFQYDSSDSGMDSFSKGTQIVPGVQCQIPELDARVQKFIAISNHFLHGKVVLVQFLGELSSVLGLLSKVALSGNNGFPPILSSKHMSWDKPFLEELSGANSPMSDTSKSDGSEKAATKVAPTEESSSVSKNECSPQELSRIEDELRKVRSEKLALETHMRAEFRRFDGMEQELSQLKIEKVDLENSLGLAKGKLEYLKLQLSEAEQLVANLRVQLASAESSKQLADEQLSSMASLKAELESQLKENGFELNQLHEKVETLEKSIVDEHRKNGSLETQCQEFRELLQKKSVTSCSQCASTGEGTEQASKDWEIAAATEKLAECQRTILVLGEQLKIMASSKDTVVEPVAESIDQCLDGFSSGKQRSSHSSSTLWADDISEGGSSARFADRQHESKSRRHHLPKKDLPWDPRDVISSDLLDAELAILSKGGPASGRTLYDVFGGRIPVHEDYIEAVAQMPSSPEEEPVSSKKPTTKHPHKKKRSPRSFAGVDLSKSMNDAGSPAATEKHSSSFTRFFSRTKSSS